MVETIVLNHRYKRFVNTWAKSPLNDMDGEQLGVPKMHAVLRTTGHLLLGGCGQRRTGTAGKRSHSVRKRGCETYPPPRADL